MFTRFAMLAIVLVAVCTPRSAEAARYFWKNVNDGKWNTATNWENIDDPTAPGYPNAPGDEAHFTLAYTKSHTVNIPDTGVTVGAIYYDSHVITINAVTGGRLIMEAGPGSGTAVMRRVNALSGAADVINAPITLRSDLHVTLDAAIAYMQFNGRINENNTGRGITKLGHGRLDLRAATFYRGATSVLQGLLYLADAATPSVGGSLLAIGPRPTPDSIPEVVVDSPNQIADITPVDVHAGGLLTINKEEKIGPTSVAANGAIGINGPSGVASLAVSRLTMTGGVIESRDGGQFHLLGELTVPPGAGSTGATIRRVTGGGVFSLGDSDRTFDIGRGNGGVDLVIGIPIVAPGAAGLVKKGNGILAFALGNAYTGVTRIDQGELWIDADGTSAIRGPVHLGVGPDGPAVLKLLSTQAIIDNAQVVIGGNGRLEVNREQPELVGSLTMTDGARILVGPVPSGSAAAHLVASSLTMAGGRVEMSSNSSLRIGGGISLISGVAESAAIAGGYFVLGEARTITVGNGPKDIDATIAAIITGAPLSGVTKRGDGTLTFAANNTYGGPTTIAAGRLNINGQQSASTVVAAGGVLGGKGTTGPVNVPNSGSVAPGDFVGRLSTGSIAYASGAIFSLTFEGSANGQYSQLAVTGTVTLASANLVVNARVSPSPGASFLIIDNDGTDPIQGTFNGLGEGDEITIGGVDYAITYRGGDGNDVVIESVTPTTYYLAEGATGDFFDDDILIANPNEAQAPVTLTVLREGGATVTVQRVIPARSRVTIHVDEIAGLEDASVSVKVDSTDRLPLIVERSMFWDAGYYGGHTANAVAQPEKRWTFAEGFQGFFDTYILIANANAVSTKVTLTFLRENATPVVKTVDVDPFARKTIHTGAYPELAERAFGIVVDATEPVIAERSMYFASQPGKLWSGGHVNTGIVAPSRSWFHAEGATGAFFSTFILLSNPQDTEAKVGVKFLLDTGEVIDRPKTLAPKQRLTINPASEDPRLANAAVSTVVQSDVPIVSERSMYWEGDTKGGLGEGHNSSGIPEAGLRWGLAEGRIGGDRKFDTFILLANPSAERANVRITYLREGGAPIVKDYEVAPTSRFNVDVKTVVPELQNSSFGAIIEVGNDVPIAVERSLYWNANGAFWAGGTNALATRLPPIE